MSARRNHHHLLRQPKTTQPVLKKLSQSGPGRWLGLALGLTGVATISATAGALLAVSLSTTPLMQQKLTAEEAAVFSKNEMARGNLRFPQLTRPVNILVLGIKVLTSDLEDESQEDLGYHALVDSFKGLSDTMLLVRFDPAEKKLKVLSVPRDTRTYVEGMGMTKINDANYYGGPALSAKATSELLGGVGVDRYVRVNVQGVEKLIDALGGLDIYVPKDMKYSDDSQHLYINLEQGQHHLNGSQVLQFLRFRQDSLGDIGRVQRQQILMRAFMEQALNVGTISRLPKLVSIIQSHIDTNLSLEELVALVNFATHVNPENIEMLMVPGEFSDPKDYKASYWLPDYSRLDAILAKHFDFGYDSWRFENVDSRDLRIAIQDSTDDWDAVDGLVMELNDDGFWNVKVSKPWTQPLEVTRIVAQDGDTEGAESIQRALGFGKVVVESTGFLESDVTIQLGQDWLEKYEQQQRLENLETETEIENREDSESIRIENFN
ncbi:cell envelope-related function transcriptional attenuator common domain protein [Lyngbya aestuarii BL J]|mgnify:CR=1 FL=1|uniref:Cell envelope-related function transcriptional attenuator common domain protein n=1 Tax=Lyngbya aestuarii BL J TaxID=1348334 RepID=U7QPM6_9CYAN|nr:LCP family protein [Lyngbya aestuarii]ERT09894.1 cell envelope-related function transcriptional attenuator common domain protein [Lyngbya aestuarii BL J]